MSSITVKKDECIVHLNRKFYPEEIIEKGISTFKDADVTISKEGDLIVRKKQDEDAREQTYEFCDYLLSLIQE